MKRRGFLGFLAGGAVAGPGMVKAAAEQTLAGLSVDGGMSGPEGWAPPMPNYVSGGTISTATLAGQLSNVAHMQADLARLLGKSEARKRRERASINVHALSPDIAALRSVSLTRKVAMQRELNYAASEDHERRWIERAINHALGMEDDDM